MSRSPESENTGNAGKLKVLVVDDEPTLRLGFSYALADNRTCVDTAATGQEALDRLAASPHDIVILDLRMPELDGMGVIQALRREGNQIPVVLCSADLTPHAALAAIRYGVVDFLLKPVRPVDLREVIEFVIHPENRPLPQAMRAARRGDAAEAIRILQTEKTPGRQACCWLDVLECIRDADPQNSPSPLEDKIGSSLSILAFNAPTVP